MTMYQFALKRFLASKVTLILILAAPIGIVAFTGLGSGGNELASVRIADDDASELSRAFLEHLELAAWVEVVDKEALRTEVFTGNAEVGFHVPGGFERRLLDGEQPRVGIVRLREHGDHDVAVRSAESFLRALRTMAAWSDDRETFDSALGWYRDERLGVETHSVSSPTALSADDTDALRNTSGYLFVAMLLLATNGAFVLLKDRKAGVAERILTGPTTMRRYMASSVAGLGTVFVAQIALLLGVVALVYPVSAEPALAYLAVLAAFALVSVALAVTLAGVTRTEMQLSTISTVAVLLLAMLGGSFWPYEIVPELLQRVGAFLPTTWANRAVTAIVSGASLPDIAGHLAVLAAFAVVVFIVGSRRARGVVLSK